jgi:hypothetical protein
MMVFLVDPSTPFPAKRASEFYLYSPMMPHWKKKNIFLIYKKIQGGAVAKSFMRKGFLIHEEMRKYFPIQYMRRPAVIYEFATAPFWISIYRYEENLIFFLSVHSPSLWQ